MDTTARHISIMPPTPQATRPVQLHCRRCRKLRLAPFRQDSAWICWMEDSRGQARKSRNEISSACNAIIYEHYVILYYIIWGPPVGDPTAMYAPPLRYKREALVVHNKLSSSLGHTSDSLGTQLHNTSNTTHSGRRVLRSGGPNHSKPAMFIVFLSEIELVLANPRVLTLWA